MGIDMTFEKAYAKAAIAAGNKLPAPGSGVFISVRNEDKLAVLPVAQGLHKLGYKILATQGTGKAMQDADVPCEIIFKISEGRPNAGTNVACHYAARLAVSSPLGTVIVRCWCCLRID